ncbi:MAG: 50S ribosomal protein L3 [Chloroflexi bacterium]|nr:50S ribosomal protein L3 [Chloroflexota bacterium]
MTTGAGTLPGLIGRKLGMTQLFREDGAVIPVTAIEVGPCTVVQVKTREKEGYSAVQMGFGEKKRLTSPEKGHLKGLGSFRHLREFRVGEGVGIEVGQKFDVGLFKPGDIVDVTGTSKGKGFAGVVKRHHFSGGPKTHGQSDRHRAPGSIGSATTPGRVYKGKKMAGHMGNARVTVMGQEVVQADPARNLLLVRGAVPGHQNSLVLIQKGRP